MAPSRGKGRADGVAGVADAGAFFVPAEAAHSGHRERLRARFLKGGAEAMPDYELLELTLFEPCRGGTPSPSPRRCWPASAASPK